MKAYTKQQKEVLVEGITMNTLSIYYVLCISDLILAGHA